MKKLFIILVVLALLIVPMLVFGLDCDTSCTTGFPFMAISNTHNAHVGISGSYATRICCNVLTTTGGDSPDAEIFLSWTDNAHASETYNANWYPVSLTLASTDCVFENNACTDNRECVISLSASTNAHVGECADYANKLCCCEDFLFIPELCGDIEAPHGITPGCDGDWRCCDDTTDCVWDTGCFNYGQTNGGLNCSNANTWCPIGFHFNTGSNQCEYEGTYCDMGNPPTCEDVFNNPVFCIEPDIPSNIPDACCDVDISYGGYDYYDWITVIIY